MIFDSILLVGILKRRTALKHSCLMNKRSMLVAVAKWWNLVHSVNCVFFMFALFFPFDLFNQAKLQWIYGRFCLFPSLVIGFSIIFSLYVFSDELRFPQSEIPFEFIEFPCDLVQHACAMWFCYFVHDFSESRLSVHRDERHNVSMCRFLNSCMQQIYMYVCMKNISWCCKEKENKEEKKTSVKKGWQKSTTENLINKRIFILIIIITQCF